MAKSKVSTVLTEDEKTKKTVFDYVKSEYPTVRVKFREKGYPFSFIREWQAAGNDTGELLNILLHYVEEWSIIDLDEKVIELPDKDERTADLLDNVDEVVVSWLILRFGDARSKGLSAPKV